MYCADERVGLHQQRGAALLVILLVLMVASAATLVTKTGETRARLLRERASLEALADAKAALLEFAVTYPDRVPGQSYQLPCPDLDATGPWLDGESHDTACGSLGVSVLGRIPWRTLGIKAPQDASGSCVWYAVSGTYKSADLATAEMINPDSNGQFRVFDALSGGLMGGGLPEDRAVALLFAPEAPLEGQARGGAAAEGCSANYAPAAHLDGVSALGVSNAALSGSTDAVDDFVRSAVANAEFNDRVLAITRADLADAVYRRPDFAASMSALTRGVASCLAAYGLQNPSGANDRRLPWPAPAALSDYSLATTYDDEDTGRYSGRLADIVDQSNVETGNAVSRVLSDCNPALAPDWDPAYLAVWQQWKDHLFYSVAESYEPRATVPTACGNCLSVNGSGAYAAIVVFANRRLSSLSQRRDAPPIDADTKQDVVNYLEGVNATNHPYTGGAANYVSAAASTIFNDILFCIDETMSVSPC